ncbi:excinuclease ABC subunit UvrC [Methylococcus geothermalis]|uniref:UvrABC system protein C n=1 Tax=Methylococcus geothermalis TaxID=2681310 RepID=A0A858Q8M3_9GAMM|nr:excinuclease ABC subunit UvrC [Methylococcus geothermalis]QJD30173.1 excinuclease ABC subunit UvrC [Methylococcus geothermalis]
MSTALTATAFDIRAFLATLTGAPGVYKMLDGNGEVIYVGKAKNLKKRVASHFAQRDNSPKQNAMVARVQAIEVTVTRTEGEALLLENQLIKRHKPRYNINLRDDKSYPYIYVSTHQEFPRLAFHRGSRARPGRFFGPFPSAAAVRDSLKTLQKIFPVRQCEDSYFANRTRPCLQYQIERCTGPCVELIGPEAYGEDVANTLLFLEGRGEALIDRLAQRMEQAALRLEFEKAARYRDQIANLRTVLAKQLVSGEQGDLDMIACAIKGNIACVHVVFIRHGQQIGDRSFFPRMQDEHDAAAILEAFIPQFYLDKEIPRELLLSHGIRDHALFEAVLGQQAKRGVKISWRLRGERAKRLELAQANADYALNAKLASQQTIAERLQSLTEMLGLDEPPSRMECFDISHTQGDQTVASCVVFDRNGPLKSAYRRFNIEGITGGDDYAAMVQALSRRYQRVRAGEIEAPDILFIDGGKGQIHAAAQTLDELGMGNIRIIGIAKGPDRKPGRETLFKAGSSDPIVVEPNNPGSLLIQHIRDEAHRFAITGHRQRRAKAATQSPLQAIAGLGPKRRQQLLRQFGGLRQISHADVDALSSVEGINRQLAQRIYDMFHDHGA